MAAKVMAEAPFGHPVTIQKTLDRTDGHEGPPAFDEAWQPVGPRAASRAGLERRPSRIGNQLCQPIERMAQTSQHLARSGRQAAAGDGLAAGMASNLRTAAAQTRRIRQEDRRSRLMGRRVPVLTEARAAD